MGSNTLIGPGHAAYSPYLNTILWRSRAQRALTQLGDATDAIVTLQAAAESPLWNTYRMILIDEGCDSGEVDLRLVGETPFKALLTTVLPTKPSLVVIGMSLARAL